MYWLLNVYQDIWDWAQIRRKLCKNRPFRPWLRYFQ